MTAMLTVRFIFKVLCTTHRTASIHFVGPTLIYWTQQSAAQILFYCLFSTDPTSDQLTFYTVNMPSPKLCVWCGKTFARLGSHEYRCTNKKVTIARARTRRDMDLPPASGPEDSVMTSTSTPAVMILSDVSLAPPPEVPEVLMSSGMNGNDHTGPQGEADDLAIPTTPSRPMRQTRLPKKFADFTLDGNREVRQLQHPTPSLSLPPSPSQSQCSLRSPSRSPSLPRQPTPLTSRLPSGSPTRSPSPDIPMFVSEPNNAGLFRVHRYYQPLNDLELGTNLENTSESTSFLSRQPDRVFGPQSDVQDIPEIPSTASELPSHYPHPNPSIGHLMLWHHGSALMKSKADLDRLVKDVLLQPDFTTDDLIGFSTQRKTDRVYLHPQSASNSSKQSSVPLPFQNHDGWVKGEVQISLPRARNHVDEKEMSEPYSADFHLKPYKLIYKHPIDPSRPVQRVYGESYTSNRMLPFEDEIQRQLHGHAEGNPEVGIIAIMLYSDSTQLANFGDASLWPGYLTFANWSKYTRLKPSSLAMNHIIYFPALPKTIQEHYQAHFDQLASESEIRFCKVELLHAVWHLLVSDPRFVAAYRDSYLERCADGIVRLLFYRFFCYSADYVEKVMLACIKYLSEHPCALCLTKKDQIHLIGTAADLKRHSTGARHDTDEVRQGIAQARDAVFSQGYAINNENNVQVHLKTTSTLAVQVFQSLGLNHYEMFMPDSLHDLSGRISDLLKHNVRLINTLKGKKEVEYLDMRYRLVPTFGNGTIRRFKTKVSNFSRFASRDYQDALQCAMPCFEGLFPQDLDSLIQDLLFVFATYESYSNLRQHTDSTIATMKKVTKELGRLLCQYIVSVANVHTVEMDTEVRSRRKRDPDGGKDPRRKAFTLLNYKSHMLGHYPAAIVTYGTTDGTSTQAGEREHRRVKNKYQITNKNKPEGQIAALVMVEHRQKRMTLRGKTRMPATEYEELPASDPSSHHQLPLNRNRPMTLGVLLDPRAPYDPVIKDFRAKLYRHLMSQILDMDPSLIRDTELYRLSLVSDQFYRHERFRVYYTSYDCRCKKETIGYRRRPHIMTLANEPVNSHPRLPRLYFPNANDADAFDFIDPARVIRAAHIIPAFDYNTTNDLLRHDSMARLYEEYDEGQYVKEDQDYRYYYVNMFPDTDMFMRYRGGGIGHLQFHEQLHEQELEATAGDPSIPEYDINGDPVAGTDEVLDMEEDDEEMTFEEMIKRATEDDMDIRDDIDHGDSDSVDDNNDDQREVLSDGEDSGDESG
ncbi:hypothetical protein PQX77_003527 [Marasmius sp. AFHP31]|nr:hypothetical protein PQX77_003527 [Marasmius sp. AFHP31]